MWLWWNRKCPSFSIECAFYQDIRRDMLAVISPICTPNLNTLIYGNPEASSDDNIVIFKAVQRFIYKSKRFNQWFKKHAFDLKWFFRVKYVLFNVLVTLTTVTLVTKLLTSSFLPRGTEIFCTVWKKFVFFCFFFHSFMFSYTYPTMDYWLEQLPIFYFTLIW